MTYHELLEELLKFNDYQLSEQVVFFDLHTNEVIDVSYVCTENDVPALVGG